MNKILIIEDHKEVSDMLCASLEGAGYEVSAAYTGTDGIRQIREQSYQLVLLDIMLPYKSGDEILREARTFTDIPIIVLSAKDMVGTKIDLLKAGADDYITKPFDLGEVNARVESHLRRFGKKTASLSYEYKDMVLSVERKSVSVAGQTMELTATEYGILERMLQYPEKVFTKANLYDAIWKDNYLEDDNVVKTHMSNLRRKLKEKNPVEEYIETVWGLGYRMHKASAKIN